MTYIVRLIEWRALMQGHDPSCDVFKAGFGAGVMFSVSLMAIIVAIIMFKRR